MGAAAGNCNREMPKHREGNIDRRRGKRKRYDAQFETNLYMDIFVSKAALLDVALEDVLCRVNKRQETAKPRLP